MHVLVHPKCSLLKLAYSKTTQGQPQQKTVSWQIKTVGMCSSLQPASQRAEIISNKLRPMLTGPTLRKTWKKGGKLLRASKQISGLSSHRERWVLGLYPNSYDRGTNGRGVPPCGFVYTVCPAIVGLDYLSQQFTWKQIIIAAVGDTVSILTLSLSHCISPSLLSLSLLPLSPLLPSLPSPTPIDILPPSPPHISIGRPPSLARPWLNSYAAYTNYHLTHAVIWIPSLPQYS